MSQARFVIATRSLFARALSDFWRWKKPLILVVAVVAIPLVILSALGGLGADATFSAYSSFATLVMNLALLWVIRRKLHGEPVTIKQAYYHGSAPLVKLLLIAAVLALMLLPFAFGALIYINGVTGATLVASTSEKLVLALIWLVFAIPSLLLISRYVFAIYGVLEPQATPMQALHESSRLVKRRNWRVAGRLAALGIVALLVLTVPTAAATTAHTAWVTTLGLAIVQLLSTLIVLPISNLYLYHLYESLSA